MQELDARKKKLDSYFERVSSAEVSDQIRADLAQLGAVLVCGFVERSVEIVVLDRLTGLAHPRVKAFVKAHFKKGTNYDCEAICQLLVRFDLKWEANMREFIRQNDRLISSLKSAYTLRNSIAHGGTGNRGLVGVSDLYKDAKFLVDGLVNCTAQK